MSSWMVALCYREGDITNPWQEAGTIAFATQEYFQGDSNTDLEFPITTWSQTPQLKLKVRLTQSINEGDSSTVTIFGRQNGMRSLRRQDNNGNAEVELPQPTSLTLQEEVLVKDAWNKLRAWKELQMEKFFKRLLLEEPDLEYLFGEAIDSMADFFYELFDCCVHQLQPETQNIVGEPLMGVPPEREHGSRPLKSTASFLQI